MEANPTLLVFVCDESPCCRALHENLDWFTQRHEGHLDVARFDVWEDPRSVIENQVLTVPTLILEIGGRQVARLRGYMSKRVLMRRLEPLLGHDQLVGREEPHHTLAASRP